MTQNEIIFGPVNLQYKPHFFVKRLNIEIVHLDSIKLKVNDETELKKINERISLIKEVLS
jgi:tRNA A22 N-methylase